MLDEIVIKSIHDRVGNKITVGDIVKIINLMPHEVIIGKVANFDTTGMTMKVIDNDDNVLGQIEIFNLVSHYILRWEIEDQI